MMAAGTSLTGAPVGVRQQDLGRGIADRMIRLEKNRPAADRVTVVEMVGAIAFAGRRRRFCLKASCAMPVNSRSPNGSGFEGQARIPGNKRGLNVEARRPECCQLKAPNCVTSR